MPSILDTFSPEILDLILKEVKECEPGTFKRVRLVCRTVNELVEPMVCDAVRLCYPGPREHGMRDILSSITSGTSPFIRHATKLRVELPPVLPPVGSSEGVLNTTRSEMVKPTLSTQARALIPAIKALTKVKRVAYNWDPKEEEPYVAVMTALSSLQELQSIEIRIVWQRSIGANLGFALFSNLTEILLCHHGIDERMIPDVGGMIANCPSLSSLLLQMEGRSHAHRFHFTDFIKPSLALPSFQPSLKSLRMFSALSMSLSPSCIPFLRCLTRLEFIPLPIDEPNFWPSLTASTIRLRYLRLPRLSMPVVRYITSYTGLEELMFDYSTCTMNRSCGLSPQEEIQLVYQSILPKHRQTLRTLGLACDPIAFSPEEVMVNDEWFVRQEHLRQIVACGSLEHLEFKYYHFDPCDPIPNSKARLPLVRKLAAPPPSSRIS